MDLTVITEQEIASRRYWIDKISRLSGNFGVDSDRVEQEIAQEIETNGIASLIGHLRLCGAIPERYEHSSSEEKLYSKYTDVVIHEAYTAMGFTSLVLRERADVADVECVCDDYSFVAAERERIMRLSREQAIREVLKGRKIENRIRAVESVADNDLLGLE